MATAAQVGVVGGEHRIVQREQQATVDRFRFQLIDLTAQFVGVTLCIGIHVAPLLELLPSLVAVSLGCRNASRSAYCKQKYPNGSRSTLARTTMVERGHGPSPVLE
jgi:hypothetical protein